MLRDGVSSRTAFCISHTVKTLDVKRRFSVRRRIDSGVAVYLLQIFQDYKSFDLGRSRLSIC